MRIVLLVVLLINSINAGLVQKDDINKYNELTNLITFNTANKLDTLKSKTKEELVRPNIDDEPLLFIASKYRKEDVFKILLAKGLNPNVIFNKTTLIHHILADRTKYLKHLNLDSINFLTIDGNGDIPLNFITEKYNLKHLQPFLDKIDNSTKNLENKNKNSQSFLHLLVGDKNIKALQSISGKYKIKYSTSELLKYSFKKDIQTFEEILKMVEDDRVFYIENKNNIITHILQEFQQTSRGDYKKKANEALSLIYNHLRSKNKLEFLYSKNKEGMSFVELSIFTKNDTFINLFFEDKKILPLTHKTLKIAIMENFKNKKLFSIIPQTGKENNILHSMLSEDVATKNLNNYITYFDYKKLNKLDRINKEHFIETAIANKKWDFIFKLLTSHVENIKINDKHVVSLIENNIELSHRLILDKNTNPALFSDTFLFYLIGSDKIPKVEKEVIIKFFFDKHIKTKKDLKSYFFDKDKRGIVLINLIELKMPYSNIISEIKKTMNIVEEEPFLSIYNNKEIPDFYKNSLLKKNSFGSTVIKAAIQDNYKHLKSLIADFRKQHPQEWTETLAFYKNDSLSTYNSLIDNIETTQKPVKKHVIAEFSALGETLLLKILNKDKIIIKKDNINFETFLKPLFLYNKSFYKKIPRELILPFSEELIELFIKTKDHRELLLFERDLGYDFSNRKLGDYAIMYNYPNVEYLVAKGIDLNFRLQNNYTYMNNLILAKDITKLEKVSKSTHLNILDTDLFETKHVLDLLFVFNNINVLKNIKEHNTKESNNLFFGEKYKLFITNQNLNNFQMYLKNGLFSHKDIDIYREIFKQREDITELFKSIYQKDLDYNTKEKIIEEILLSGKLQLLPILEKEILVSVMEKPLFIKNIIKKLNEKETTKIVNFLLKENIKINIPTIQYLYENESYLLVRTIYKQSSEENFTPIKNELLDYLLSVKEDNQNSNLFNYVLNKHYKDLKITKKHLIDSVPHKGKFIQLLKKSSLNESEYQEVFGHLLTTNPKHTMFKQLLKHPIGGKISFNKFFNDKHLLEIMIERDLVEMFDITLEKLKEEISKEVVEKTILALQKENDLLLYDKHIKTFNELITKHNINLVHTLLSDKFNLEFIIYSLQKTKNIHLKVDGAHTIFELFKNKDVENINKIKLFYLYKNRQINILEKDQNNKSIIHYLADFGIKEDNLYNLLMRMPNDTKIRFLQNSGLLNHIIENKLPYDNFIKRNLSKEKIEFPQTEYPFQLRSIESKDFELFSFFVDEGYIDTQLEDVDGKTLVQYCIEVNEIKYLKKLSQLSIDFNSDDVEFAKTLNVDNEIISYLTERSEILYKINKYFMLFVNNTLYLSLLGGTLLVIIVSVWGRKVYKRRQQEKMEEQNKLTAQEMRLEELKKKLDEAKNNKELDIDEETLRGIEAEFEELNQNKATNIMDIDIDTETGEPIRFRQDDIDSFIDEINQPEEGKINKQEDNIPEKEKEKASKEYQINDDLLKEIAKDFDTEEGNKED